MLCGAGSNAVATISNGGFMPVAGREAAHGIWIPLTDASQYPYLADVLVAGTSIGDILLLGGLCFMLLFFVVRQWRGNDDEVTQPVFYGPLVETRRERVGK